MLVLPDPFDPVRSSGQGRSETAIRRRYDNDPSTSLSTPANRAGLVLSGLQSALTLLLPGRHHSSQTLVNRA